MDTVNEVMIRTARHFLDQSLKKSLSSLEQISYETAIKTGDIDNLVNFLDLSQRMCFQALILNYLAQSTHTYIGINAGQVLDASREGYIPVPPHNPFKGIITGANTIPTRRFNLTPKDAILEVKMEDKKKFEFEGIYIGQLPPVLTYQNRKGEITNRGFAAVPYRMRMLKDRSWIPQINMQLYSPAETEGGNIWQERKDPFSITLFHMLMIYSGEKIPNPIDK